MLTVEEVRADCPILKRFAYLDSGATTLTPLPVIQAMSDYLANFGVNVERSAYRLAQEACEQWDAARGDAARFLLGCPPEELIFTRNCTEGINVVANALLNHVEWRKGDEIVGTTLEHHANELPWMRLARQAGVKYRMIAPAGCIIAPSDFESIGPQTKVVAFQHVSNVLGSEHPVRDIIREVRRRAPDAFVMLDGSQGPGHLKFNVAELGCDAYSFSGHKGPLGPPGSGGLWLKREHVESFEPLILGGGVVANVTETEYALRAGSKRFEAGTPNTPGLIGLGRAARYVGEEIGIEHVHKREQELTKYLLSEIEKVKGVETYGDPDLKHRVGTVSFNLEGWRATDLALAVDEMQGVLVRAGHHCAMPLARRMGVEDDYGGTVRASFHYYNTFDECDRLVRAVKELAG